MYFIRKTVLVLFSDFGPNYVLLQQQECFHKPDANMREVSSSDP